MSEGITIKMKTKQSLAEQEMKELLKECEDIVDYNYLTTEDAKKIIKAGAKILMKCEELRLSRDNWRNKFETLNHGKVKE